MKAIYTKCGLPDYDGNPLISALPPLLEPEEVTAKLAYFPAYNPEIRKQPGTIRQHALLSIQRFFQPLSHHVDLEGKISRTLRFGYTNRNPTENNFFRDLPEKARGVLLGNAGVTSTGFAVVGTSGTGKTTAFSRILKTYPQVITHTNFEGNAFPHTQLVWMKLECPFDGSIKSICRKFFETADALLGTDYQTLYGSRRLTADEMLPKIALIGGIHTLGVLVIDEIQHLSMSKSGGASKMLNFFVELTNTMGMPVILVGTTKAIGILSQEFRMARRITGQGEMVWRPMKKDAEWDIFLEGLWGYQVTKELTPLTEEFSAALHEETQGITDFAVKLYMLAQIRAIVTGVEKLTPNLLRSVARDSLQTAQPFLQALRKGDYTRLPNFEDIIQPLDYVRLADEERAKHKIEIVPVPKLEKPVVIEIPKPLEKRMVKDGMVEIWQNRKKKSGYMALKDAGFVEAL